MATFVPTALPQYTRQVVPSGVGPTPRLDGGNSGAALANLGSTLGQVGAQVQHAQEIKANEDAATWTANAMSAAHVAWIDRLQKAQDEAPLGAAGFAGSVDDEFTKYAADQVQQAPDEKSKRFLGERLAALRTTVYGHAVTFEASQGVKYRNDQWDETTKNVAALAARDPEQAKTALAEADATLQASAHKEWALDRRDKLRSVVSVAAAQGMVERDPAGSLKLLDSYFNDPKGSGNLFIDKLDPAHAVTLRNRAQADVLRMQNQDRAAIDKQMKVAQETVDTLQKFALSGEMVSPAYEAQIVMQTAGTPYEEPAKLIVAQSMKGAAFGSQPLPVQDAVLSAWDAKKNVEGTNPAEMAMVAHAREVRATQGKAYTDNPWAASTRFARFPPVADAPMATAGEVPQYVAKIAPLMGDIERNAGQPVSPLQPAQAQAFTEQLAKLPPGPRAEVLGQTGEQLTAPRIQALAEQIDKKDRPLALALKVGSGRTSLDRAVSETMLRGADALRDKTVKRDDATLTGWRSEIAGMIRGTLGDERAENDAIDAAYYTRAGMDEPGYPGAATNVAAVKLVIGQPLDRAGVKTILPRGMDENAFTDKLRQYTPEVLAPMAMAPTVMGGAGGVFYVRGQSRTLEQLSSALPGMGMRRNPAGGYTPVSGGAFVTLDEAGTIPLRLPVQ